ncbi:glycoside hydrolase family 172 protein [Endozoicomonas sp. SESOKO1]|uniref:glycoside hydrolase family 172 protein n=1 Tax=Endozoicomonas sp. SESOKO1 TaxID=2828742 RepID=UPI002148A6CE|nr:glycoside hydrolase family 172 protein [Endozoicomonas sp. SESOKO1]
MKRTHFILAALFASSVLIHENAFAEVSFKSLLEEMTNREALAREDKYDFTLAQASSYDRASKSPAEDWFANGDGSGFIREEVNHGRKERVLMDVQGPGAIVRFWSTYLTWGFKNGTIRFYLDGSDKPAIEGKFLDIISGKLLADGILSARTGTFREDHKGKGYLLSGVNLYVPIPYENGCKVTYEGEDDPFYFAINYRAYEKGTPVKTFAMQELKDNAKLLADTQQDIVENKPYQGAVDGVMHNDITLAPNTSKTITITGEKAIRKFAMKLISEDYKQALRSTVIEMKFDGKKTVWTPVGDFFSTGYTLATEFNGRYHKVSFDGEMSSQWIMPFQRNAEITIHNFAEKPVTIKNLSVKHTQWDWNNDSLYFHANWHTYSKIPTHPHRDLNYITIDGKGKYVGDSLAIYNYVDGEPKQPWWGEGDEKIYIDGETFPSHFGTGTEDYYSYAWVGCATFAQPFLGQPIAQGNRGIGLTVNNRWRALDVMTFNKSLKLDMELWHWAGSGNVDYAPTTFWYGTAESKASLVNNPHQGVKTPVRFNERIEAEAFKIETKSNAESVVYSQPENRAWSNRSQLFISNFSKGDVVNASFYSGEEKTGTLTLVAQKLPAVGAVTLKLNDKPLVADFNAKGKGTLTIPVPNTTLKQGRNTISIQSINGGDMALDYLTIK